MKITENLGTVVKINLSVEPIDGMHMDDMPFRCRFFTYSNKAVEVEKGQMIRVDADNYVAVVDSSMLSVGDIKCRFEADIPDSDIQGGFRKEIVTFSTGIQMQP